MQSPVVPGGERESQVLRASVIEAAFSLGPKVAQLIFEEPIVEEASLYEVTLNDQIPTPGLTSSASSEDSHSSGFISPDGYPGQEFWKTGKRSHPKISLPLQLGAASKTTLEQGYYLESPFVVVNDFPSSLTSSAPLKVPQTPPRKKPLKGFLFTPRKRNKTPIKEPKDQMKRLDISAPVRSTTISSEETTSSSASTTSPVSPPRPFSPSSASNSANSRITPSRLRKQYSRQRDWDFKDVDRPSFFMDQSYVTKNSSETDLGSLGRSSSTGRGGRSKSASRKPSYGEDSGYLSEGSGLRYRREKDQSGKPPLKRSISSRFMRKLSGDSDEPIPPLPRALVSLPIASRYASQRDDERLLSPNDIDPTRRTGKSPYGYGSRDTIYSSVSSFSLMPDLNAAKRLGLDKYAKLQRGAVGSDNDLKLEMLAKLLSVRPIPRLEAEDVNQMINKRNTLYVSRTKPIKTNLASPKDRSQYPTVPQSARADLEYSYRSPIEPRGRQDISFAQRAQRARSPIRGREAPFPVKSILRNAPQVRTISPTLLYTPDRYQGLDVPRSVKSSYSKEMEREPIEEGDEEDEDEDDDSVSVYSGYTKYVDDETTSRASFMDIPKSEKAREMLIGGVLGNKADSVY